MLVLLEIIFVLFASFRSHKLQSLLFRMIKLMLGVVIFNVLLLVSQVLLMGRCCLHR